MEESFQNFFLSKAIKTSYEENFAGTLEQLNGRLK